MPNKNYATSKTDSNGDSVQDIVDIKELMHAIFTLREAMARALLWNLSVAAIQEFLFISNYCKKDLEGCQKRAVILTAFADYILGRNALNWQNSVAFLSTNELVHVWSTWFSQQPVSSFIPKKKKLGREKKDLCRRYNEGKCTTTGPNCKTYFGKVLQHLCNATTSSGQLCEQNHPRKDHK